MNGVFFINKEENWTSFDVCAKLRKVFSTKKVGHSGTLDPFAEGLMIVCLGQATKIIPFLENYDKSYTAVLKLGEETDTLDKTGKVILSKEVKEYSKDEIESVLNFFLGKIEQVPPMYSALKKDGLPLYALAREGITIERKTREIEVFSIELVSYSNLYITFNVRVSKGTYIRTLGSDIAHKLGTVGHLVSLKRTSIGKFDLSLAKKVSDICIDDKISIVDLLSYIDTQIVDSRVESLIRNGVRLSLKGDDVILLINRNKEALAIYEKREDGFYYTKRGLFDASDKV